MTVNKLLIAIGMVCCIVAAVLLGFNPAGLVAGGLALYMAASLV
jgi:hypothetical protein